MSKQTNGKVASAQPPSKAQLIRDYFANNPKATNHEVQQMLKEQNIETTVDYISKIKNEKKKARRRTKKGSQRKGSKKSGQSSQAKYPRHSIDKVLRIPRAILEQNAGKDCTQREAAKYVGVGYAGPFRLEISSAIKYGLLNRPSSGRIEITETARKILRPHEPKQELQGLREAILRAPDISDVYNHYRGEIYQISSFLTMRLLIHSKYQREKLRSSNLYFWRT